ncbi:hypothetical protein D9611_013565 [Ephemerocybe angulata]|uniref:Uncharacterized protein n=1 Tax=Ephemerocybe angulata TaxID=980116 RepID=A0A8H5C3M0_9AGAR|nr:hypothetical protein D9611_013565 [Tulosesus angulatus]
MPGASSSTDFTAIVRMYNAKVYTNVRLMWPAPFGLPKVMFFAVRYYLLISNVFSALGLCSYPAFA